MLRLINIMYIVIRYRPHPHPSKGRGLLSKSGYMMLNTLFRKYDLTYLINIFRCRLTTMVFSLPTTRPCRS